MYYYLFVCNYMLSECFQITTTFHFTHPKFYISIDESILASVDDNSIIFLSNFNNFTVISKVSTVQYGCFVAVWTSRNLLRCFDKNDTISKTYDPYTSVFVQVTANNFQNVSSYIYYPFAIGSNDVIIYSYDYQIYGFNVHLDIQYFN
jgi:uncharacterized BrkB/YihY/UPF0761 family membrane protein